MGRHGLSSVDAYLQTVRSRGTAANTAKQCAAVEAMTERLFHEQLEFVLDRARRKAALCARRAGKTFACVVMILRAAFATNAANILYLAITRMHAQKLIWLPLKQINSEYNLGLRFNETFLTCTTPGGSTIQLHGAENRSEIDKHRGQAFDLVVIDEAKSFDTQLLSELINEILTPALNDRLGQLVLTGTPGPVLAGTFFEATTVGSKGVRLHGTTIDGPIVWSLHRWAQRDNVAMPHIWELSLLDKQARGISDSDPVWRREALGEWCPSDDLMVYHLGDSTWLPDPSSSNPHGLPDAHDWYYILGIDFGFEDDFAVVVTAWSPSHPVLYHVWDYKTPHATIGQMAEVIEGALRRFGEFDGMVADTGGFGKALLATLCGDYGYPFEAAEKTEKRDYIELVNSDMRSGKLMIKHSSLVHREMELLQWQDSRKMRENKATANHASDALLYTWRYAQHHHSKPKPEPLQEGSPEFARKQRADIRDRYRKRRTNDDQLGGQMFAGYDDVFNG